MLALLLIFLKFILQVHFRVADIKYPSIPIEQKEDAEPFAPLEIIVSHAFFNMPYLNNLCYTLYYIINFYPFLAFGS